MVEEVLQQLAETTDQVATELQGKSVDEVRRAGTSRYVGPSATREAAEHIAAGGSYCLVEPEAKQRLAETKAGGGFGTQVKALPGTAHSKNPFVLGEIMPVRLAPPLLRSLMEHADGTRAMDFDAVRGRVERVERPGYGFHFRLGPTARSIQSARMELG